MENISYLIGIALPSILLILTILFIISYRRYNSLKRKLKNSTQEVIKKDEMVQKLHDELKKHKEELELQNEHVESAYVAVLEHEQKLESVLKELRESIRAAETIQSSILPSDKNVKKILPESFILTRPKDVIGGDFFWLKEVDNKIIIAVIDCVGHGVSGALISVQAHHLLNLSIAQQKQQELKASEILDTLHVLVSQDFNNVHDPDAQRYKGMDIALCIIDHDQCNIQFAGAKNPLYLIRNDKLLQISANKSSIGQQQNGPLRKFDNQTIDIQTGDMVYMFTDGYADQIGEESEQKFMYPKFRKLLLEIHKEDLQKQKQILNDQIDIWKKSLDQIDDILVLGFRI